MATDWPRQPDNPVPDDKIIDAINDLNTTFKTGGWLSTLVFNIRNTYCAWPEGHTDNATVQTMVEGFLAEIEMLKHKS